MSDDRDVKKRRLMEEDDGKNNDQVNRLTSLLPSTVKGGLQKPSGQKERSENTGKSLLGLDRLADEKRREQQQPPPPKPMFKSRGQKNKRQIRQTSADDSPERGNEGRRRDNRNRGRESDSRRSYQNGNRGRDSNHYYQKSDGRDFDRRRDNRYDERDRDRSGRGGGRGQFGSRDGGRGRGRSYFDGRGPPNRYQDRDRDRSPGNYSSDRDRDQERERHNQRDDSYVKREDNNTSESPKDSWKEDKKDSDAADNDAIYDSDGTDFDRQFYLAEDEGGYVVDTSEMEAQGHLGRFLFVNEKIKAREAEMEKRRRNPMLAGQAHPGQQQRFMSAKQSALMDDQEAWEENRLLSSGAASRGKVDLDVSTENDSRVTLLVHQIKPPFLEKSSAGFLEQQTAVATVKDNSSDFCKMAREGSATLQRLRQEKDKAQFRQKFWELGGTKMGDAMGVKKEPEPQPDGQQSSAPAQENAEGEVDYKKSSGYASHVSKQKHEAVSEFAKSKSIRQQREFLPIFSVRDELLSVIRENNVIVAVGETGSGECYFRLVATFLVFHFIEVTTHRRLFYDRREDNAASSISVRGGILQ